ncbi:hypothetical protein N7452_009528 [Penicillium brevicompactum]|uniref:Uncharacterized protein n=1 Tax=Penicillium brevicompactum TaxID=5074 RepID=A0A9W9QBT0_PENBR|nr:hypothetical protein N7452_009528 [Penicillium brevicompactum]
MDSPAKRRKISGTAGIPVVPELPKNGSRIPRRPSYQSPTRASLARTNPDALERALSRSPSRQPTNKGDKEQNPRVLGLRDRKALRPSLNASASPLTRPRGSEAPESSPSRRASGIQAFSKPPRRISKRILPGDLVFGSPLPPATNPEPDTPEGQLASELGSATRDAEIDFGPEPGFMDEDSAEPDLPPTPTQLGLEKAPDRPRGLSSSPSMRLEKRSKRRLHNPEEDTESASYPNGYSMIVREKQVARKKTAADLRRLKKEVEELELWAKKIETNTDIKSDSRGLDQFLSLLTSEEANRTIQPLPQKAPKTMSSLLATLLPFSASIPQPKRQASPLPTNPFALEENAQTLPYLTVFAPLKLKTRTTQSSHRGELSETHTLTFSPPAPFPSNLYNVTVVYEANPQTQCLKSLSVPTGGDSKKRKVPEPLRRWIDSRLENSLLKLDVVTLCWGINRYWESTFARARLWAHIDQKYGSRATKDSETEPASEDGTVTMSELRRLVPHLDRSSMVLKNESSASSPRVMVSNTLVLDEWSGEPQLRPEISVSVPGADKRIDHETKKLFHALLHGDQGPRRGVEGGVHVDAILRATEGALGALFGRL